MLPILPTLAVLALQWGDAQRSDRAAEPKFQPYQRGVLRAGRNSGQTCAVLDANVLAHTGTRAGNDLRLYETTGTYETNGAAKTSGAGPRETPYALTESSAEPGENETVAIRNEQVHGADVDFDLHMPDRAYSEIDLLTGWKDFLAVAEVSGAARPGTRGASLGALTLFDFSGEGLPGSTQLHLAEASFPWLHLHLHFMDARGGPLKRPLHTPVFSEAQIPPSRQAQVLYTPVAETQTLSNDGYWTEATLDVPEHVPLERVSVELAPSFQGDFLREVSVGARPAGSGAAQGTVLGMAESVHGSIGRLHRERPGPGMPPIHFDQLQVPVILGSNLRSPARVMVGVHNVAGGRILPVLPIGRVVLEMRRRSVCFEAQPGSEYTLRYGDAALPAPAFGYAKEFQARGDAKVARLGSEERNPAFQKREVEAGWRARSPELLWVGAIAAVALAGVFITERLRRNGPQR